MESIPEKEKGIEGLYETYAVLVHRRCMRILKSKDDAWDATQEIFIKLMHSYDTIRDKRFLLAWLIRTTTNHCISILRKKKEIEYDDGIAYDGHGGSGDNEDRLLLKYSIRKLMDAWDAKTIELVLYTYIDGYTQAEIAALTGMGESTIRKYLTRFKRKVQNRKESYDWNE